MKVSRCWPICFWPWEGSVEEILKGVYFKVVSGILVTYIDGTVVVAVGFVVIVIVIARGDPGQPLLKARLFADGLDVKRPRVNARLCYI